ncbi:hypothetical protein EV126DRAFT_414972, partial [Verticillium dahliae]
MHVNSTPSHHRCACACACAHGRALVLVLPFLLPQIASQQRIGMLNAGDACVGEGVEKTAVSHLLAENILTFVAGGWWCGSSGWRGKGALEGSGVAGSGHKQGKTSAHSCSVFLFLFLLTPRRDMLRQDAWPGEVGCLGTC